MKAAPDCIPCILRQVLNTARRVNDDPWLHRRVLSEVMQALARTDFDRTPAEVVSEMQRIATRPLGTSNPLAEDKKSNASAARALEARFRPVIEKAEDPLRLAFRLAAASNVLDAVVFGPVDLAAALERAVASGLAVEDYADLKKDLDAAKSVLYLADSAGEVIFDRLVIERLKALGKNVCYAVKKGPILNDALREDADAVQMSEVATVIDTGRDELGSLVGAASQEFRTRFEEADLVICKGAANFETTAGEAKRRYFLLAVKCAVVARHFGVQVGDVVLMRD